MILLVAHLFLEILIPLRSLLCGAFSGLALLEVGISLGFD